MPGSPMTGYVFFKGAKLVLPPVEFVNYVITEYKTGIVDL
jgi:hypothetical protein